MVMYIIFYVSNICSPILNYHGRWQLPMAGDRVWNLHINHDLKKLMNLFDIPRFCNTTLNIYKHLYQDSVLTLDRSIGHVKIGCPISSSPTDMLCIDSNYRSYIRQRYICTICIIHLYNMSTKSSYAWRNFVCSRADPIIALQK
jgi:hypothetical protein